MLEVDPAKIAQAPRVSGLFEQLKGGVNRVWEALEASDLPEAMVLVATRRKLTRDQFEAVPFEAIVIAAGMTPRHAFGVASEAMVEYSQDAARMILHAATPDIMAKSVERATSNDGTADARMLLQASNLVPRPKNTVVIHNGDVVKGNKNQVAVLPNPEDTGRRLGNRFNAEMKIPLALPAPVEEEDLDERDDEAG